ncbi:iron chelate uptake ABC transporter family permease subunit, partial [Methanocalculus sp.]|uniref:iron chelate uptake ABC transporter family permease subunit n=1 Tax=Methanocalculus sp. TaxID=2004547 RepID=UPI00262496DA
MRYRGLLAILLLSAALVLSLIISVTIGPTSIRLSSIFVDATAYQIIFDIRLPRVIAAVLVGAALATAGSAMQALFRNPMADPYIIGTSAGGSLGAVVSIV